MKVFRFSSETIQTVQRRYLKRLIPLSAAGVLIVIAVLYLLHHDKWDRVTSVIVVSSSIGFMVITQLIAAIDHREALKSYAIAWDSLTVTRSQKALYDIVIYHSEIQSIEVTKKGALLVRGQRSRDFFLVHRDIDGFEELKALLEEIHPCRPFPHPDGSRSKGG